MNTGNENSFFEHPVVSLTRQPLLIVLAYIMGLSLCLLWSSLASAVCAGISSVAFLALVVWKRAAGAGEAAGSAKSAMSAILLLCLAAACLGTFIGTMRLQMLGRSVLADLPGKWVTVDVTVTEPATVKGNRLSFIGHAARVSHAGDDAVADEDILVQLSCAENCPQPSEVGLEEGVRVVISGTSKQPSSTPGADFDYAQYLRRRGINAIISGASDRLETLPERRGGLTGVVDGLRRYSRASLNIGEWGAASELLQGMVLGDDQQVPDEVISDFRDSGLLHLLAVSGQNVVLLGFIVMLICQVLMVPRFAAACIAILVISIYVPLTGGGPSIVRAGVVGVLGLLAYLFSRQTDAYHFMAVAAALIMSVNPWSLLDPGFQLSFGAVLAIFLLAPLLAAPLAFLPPVFREGVAITTAASLMTAPIMMYQFHQVSIVTVPANVAAEIVAGPVMFLGTLAILLAPVSSLLAWTINAMACIFTGYLIVVARFFASQPGAVYNGNPPGLMAIIFFYGMLAAMVFLGRTAGISGLLMWLRRRRHYVLGLILVLTVLVGFACFSGGSAGIPPDSYTVSFLDVGQGDATLIQVPGGVTVLIDGGPGSTVNDRLEESGVTHLDAVILTHPHADHLGGLDAVLSQFPVGAFYDAGFTNSSPAYHDLLRLIDSKGIRYSPLRKGQILDYGELTLTCLNPGDTEKADDLNANSVVTVAAYRGLDILCTGDAEGETLASLDLPQVEVYKIGHHGSKDTSLRRILDKLKPDITVISVGEGNSYGHPAEDTLAKLRQTGTRIIRTDRQGTIRIALTDAGVEVRTER